MKSCASTIDKSKKLTAYCLLLVLAGCATTGLVADRTLLDFLEDGKTSKQMVMLKLGQPSGIFEGEKIVTYRIGGDSEKGYFLLERWPGERVVPGTTGTWAGTKFSLVLIFNENNILQKHSLVQVK